MLRPRLLLRRLGLVLALLCGAGATGAQLDEWGRDLVAYAQHPGAREARTLRKRYRETPADAPPAVRLVLADAASRSGRRRDAVRLLTDVVSAEPGSQWASWAGIALARLALRAGDDDAALHHLEPVVRSGGDLGAFADLLTGVVEAHRGELTEARDRFDRIATEAVALSLRTAAAMWKGYAQLWLGEAVAAVETFDGLGTDAEAVGITDDARYAAGLAWWNAGQRERATEAWAALARDDSGSARAPRRALALRPTIVIAAALRRYDRLPPRPPEGQALVLLDGDGVRLARAALARPDPGMMPLPEPGVAPSATNPDAVTPERIPVPPYAGGRGWRSLLLVGLGVLLAAGVSWRLVRSPTRRRHAPSAPRIGR